MPSWEQKLTGTGGWNVPHMALNVLKMEERDLNKKSSEIMQGNDLSQFHTNVSSGKHFLIQDIIFFCLL
jgi:hypothetical protein